MFICNQESIEKQAFVCSVCCEVVPVRLFRVTTEYPYCPFCDSVVAHEVFEHLYKVDEDTQEEKVNDSNYANEFGDLEYLLNSGT